MASEYIEELNDESPLKFTSVSPVQYKIEGLRQCRKGLKPDDFTKCLEIERGMNCWLEDGID